MTFFVVPLVNSLPFYKFRATFSGTLFTLYIRYNGRMQRYIMDVLDPSENPIVNGLPLLINRNIAGQYVSLALPEGIFFASDDTGQSNQPTQYSFGTDHTLWYEDPTQ